MENGGNEQSSTLTGKPAKGKGKRKVAHLACEACRKRRIKCDPSKDNNDATCGYCKHMAVPCVWSGQDRRRETINDLRRRLAEVEDTRLSFPQPGNVDSIAEGLSSSSTAQKRKHPPSPASEQSDQHPGNSPFSGHQAYSTASDSLVHSEESQTLSGRDTPALRPESLDT